MNNNNASIGIFDSGLGGLTVVNAVRELMPSENIIYLGDTARVPYGDKSQEIIIRFGIESASFMVSKQIKMIIIACNTVSALAIHAIRKKFPNIPIISVLEAGVYEVCSTNTENITIIGTRATINSGAYDCEIRKKSSIENIQINSIACPLFVPIVEEGLADHTIGLNAVDLYLNNLRNNPPDTLLLGCTHYPVLQDSLKSYLPDSVNIINSAHAVANFAKKKLLDLELLNAGSRNGTDEYYVTDSPETFAKHAKQFIDTPMPAIKKTIIDNITLTHT